MHDRRRRARERPIERTGTEEDREEARLAELRLPAVAVEELPDLDERQVERPERELDERVRDAEQDRDRQREAGPGRA
jgi:hypothetical protein